MQGYRIFAVEQTVHACMLHDFKISQNEKYVVIFGHEINGVEQEVVDLCDGVIEIPQHGTKHSLNIAVSAGIVSVGILPVLPRTCRVKHKKKTA